MHRRRTVLALAATTLTVGLALLGPALTAPAAQPATPAAVTAAAKIESIACSTAAGGGDFYPGPSASAAYNGRFSGSHAIPQSLLDSYIPQGLGTWPNWGGKGKDLLLLSAYNKKTNVAVLIGLIPGGGQTKAVRLTTGALGHAGGVAVVNGYLFVSGRDNTVKRFSLTTLRARLRTGGTISGAGPQQVAAASFLGVYGNTLYAGQFTSAARSATNKPTMHGYVVAANGGLTSSGGAIEVPVKTQGVVVTGTHFIYSTAWDSRNQGNIYVVRRGHATLDAAYPQDLRCFRSPSMGEGITRSNGTVYLAFEGGSYFYDDACDKPQPLEGDCTRNVIKNLHKASLAGLQSLT